jgi:hypothetical protein
MKFFFGGLKNGIPKLKPLSIKIIAKTIVDYLNINKEY